ncbi:MAG: metalloregulator ArsR/SmtB family transcription factor [Candidatus Atribacteria bacterium]|nr:metalloregulator ArsR/SmtB family transcription factor [Candidatus Atribacteria bacterium]
MKKYVKIFSALSDEYRLRIYLLLLQGELCVCELVNTLDMEQSRISHSLRILKEAKLVNNQRRGKWMIYSINQNLKNNKIIQGLKKELKLSSQDLRNLEKFKIKNVKM